MNHRPYACTVILNIISALSITVFICSSAVASGIDCSRDAQAGSDRLHPDLEQSFSDVSRSDQVDPFSIELTGEYGSNPIALWMRDSDIPFGFSPESQRLRFESIAAQQATLLDDMLLQAADEESASHIKRFSIIPSVAAQLDASELEAVSAYPTVTDIVGDAPILPVLQDSNQQGTANDASIIAVQVLTLFNNEPKRGGDFDLYVGFNNLFDADYEQSYHLPLAGQTFYGGLNWTF